MTKPIHVMREPIAVFIARESKSLVEEHWTHDGDPADLHTMWSPPWDRTRRYRIDDACSERSHRYMTAWVAAGQPEGKDHDAFHARWLASLAPV